MPLSVARSPGMEVSFSRMMNSLPRAGSTARMAWGIMMTTMVVM